VSQVKRLQGKNLSRSFAAMAAGLTDKLLGIGDIVNVLEDWETSQIAA
jgi:hypothetical protein